MSWASASLDDLCEIHVGRTPARANASFWGPGEPWLSIADMNQGRLIRTTKEQITPLAAGAGRVVDPGTVLLSFKLSIGKVAVADVPLYTNEAIAALPIKRPDLLLPEFLARALKAQDLAGGSNRAAMGATLNKAKLKHIQIPLPPVDEQRRIAAILDQADALRAKRRQALAHLEDLTHSTFLEMFGDPQSNPMSLPVRPLGELATIVTGNTPLRSESANYGFEVEWIKSDNLGQVIANSAAERLSSTGRRVARIAPAGSVLVTCIAGSPKSIGKASLVDREVAFNQQINAIIPGLHLSPRFMLEQLRVSPELVRKKSTGGMKGLVSKSAFASIRVLIPPRASQEEFERRVRRIDLVHSLQDLSARSGNELLVSLQVRAFSGSL